MTRQELIAAARQVVPEVTPEEVREKLNTGEILLIDVRDDDEWQQGHLPGAKHITRGMLEFRIDDVAPHPYTPIVLYCASGMRSLLAGYTLKLLGYQKVASMAGGIRAWREKGLPIVQDPRLTPEQMERYSRHIKLPEVGLEGQIKLLQAKVLLVGAGGLGSPAAYYLAAAGVGTLGVVDSDVVDRSNLQRQILHDMDHIGAPKTESARNRIEKLNPDVQVRTYQTRLNVDNVWEIIQDYDIILDGADNFDTRYLLNDAAYFAGKPIIHGSISQFEGMATVIHPRAGGPCYRCLYPEPATPDFAPT